MKIRRYHKAPSFTNRTSQSIKPRLSAIGCANFQTAAAVFPCLLVLGFLASCQIHSPHNTNKRAGRPTLLSSSYTFHYCITTVSLLQECKPPKNRGISPQKRPAFLTVTAPPCGLPEMQLLPALISLEFLLAPWILPLYLKGQQLPTRHRRPR